MNSEKAQMAVYNAVVVPTLTYGSEGWECKRSMRVE